MPSHMSKSSAELRKIVFHDTDGGILEVIFRAKKWAFDARKPANSIDAEIVSVSNKITPHLPEL